LGGRLGKTGGRAAWGRRLGKTGGSLRAALGGRLGKTGRMATSPWNHWVSNMVGMRLIDMDGVSIQHGLVYAGNGILHFLLGRHSNKSKTSTPCG